MFKFTKYSLILALWFTLISQTGAKEPDQISVKSPQISAENLKDSTVNLGHPEDPTCLISTFTYRGTYIQILSYSSYGYGPCDQKAFESLTLPTIAASLATLDRKPYFILKGGMNRTTASSVTMGLTAPFIEIGVLKFSIIAETILPLNVLLTSPNLVKQGFTATPYVEYPSIEKSYYFWAPGSEIYELIDRNGIPFVMTSYSSQYDPNVKLQDLKKLPAVLTLPPGWTFRMRTLDKVLQIRAKQLAGFTTVRIMDEFGNFYIKNKADD